MKLPLIFGTAAKLSLSPSFNLSRRFRQPTQQQKLQSIYQTNSYIMFSPAEIKSTPEYEVLTKRLPSARSHEIAAVVRAFTGPTANTFHAGCEESDLESCLWRAWGALITAAAETPHEKQDGLIEVIKLVRKNDLVGGDLRTARVWGFRLWKGLPVFGAAMREAWNRAPAPGTPDAWTGAQWANLNAFAARLTSLPHSPNAQFASRNPSRNPSRAASSARGVSPTPALIAESGVAHPLDFSLYGLWTLRSTFEAGSQPSLEQVAAAETWITYAGGVVIKLSLEHHAFEGKVARAGDGLGDKNWTGFNRDRLNLWLDGFENAQGAKLQNEVDERRGRSGFLNPNDLVERIAQL